MIPTGIRNHNYYYPRSDGPARLGSRMFNSTLQAAAVNGHKSIVDLLFKRAPPSALAKNDHQQATLSAVMAGHSATMYPLVDHWISPDEVPDISSMLWEAAANGKDALVRSLLDKGVNRNECWNGSWITPLQIAAFYGRTSTVDILPSGEALLRLHGTHDESDAMTCAVRHGFFKTAKLLLEHVAAIDGFKTLTSPLVGAASAWQTFNTSRHNNATTSLSTWSPLYF